MMPRRKTFFIHVGKTGGSSFNRLLGSHWRGDEHCEKHRAAGKPGRFTDLAALTQLDYISGHLLIGEFRSNFERGEYVLVTLLRDPVDHVVSHLNWIHYLGLDQTAPQFTNLHPVIQRITRSVVQSDLTDPDVLIHLLSEHRALFLNHQSRYFSSKNPPDAAEAIATLAEFDLVGTTEAYEEFLRRFVALHAMDITPHVHKENRTTGAVVTADMVRASARLLDFLAQQHAVDLAVYRAFAGPDRSPTC